MDGGPSVTSVPGSILSGGYDEAEEGCLSTGVHLQLLFQYYCRFGRSGTDHDIDTLDNAMYAKFMRDCPGLLRPGPQGQAEADLLFLKHKAKSLRRVSYWQVRGRLWAWGWLPLSRPRWAPRSLSLPSHPHPPTPPPPFPPHTVAGDPGRDGQPQVP